MNEQSHLSQAVEFLEGVNATAKRLGVTPSAVSQWLSGLRPVPLDRCADLELLTAGRWPVEVLRPDVRWARVADGEWPNPEGRPLLDLTRALSSEERAA